MPTCRSTLLVSLILLTTLGCSVQAGKIPVGTMVQSPTEVAKTRQEIKTTLNELHASAAIMGRVQNVLQRGMADRGVNMGGVSIPANLLAPSEADVLVFDSNHPERFEYRLNNSTSFSLKTRAGGTIQVVLVGTLDDTGDKLAIKDAKLEVVHEQADSKQIFHILFEKHSDTVGTESTEWSIDFRQLSELYRAMGGDDEKLASLSGFLEIRLSSKETTVTAKDFVVERDDLKLVFEVVKIHLAKKPSPVNEVSIKGYLEQNATRRGEFEVSRSANSQSSEYTLKLDIR